MKFLILILLCFSLSISAQEMQKDRKILYPNEVKKLDSSVLNRINSKASENNKYNIEIHDSLQPIPDSILLKEAENYRMYKLFGNYEEFKKKFLELKLPEMADLDLPNSKPGKNQLLHAPQDGFGIAVGGPITFLYNKFSKHEQALEKYRELQAYKPSRNIINEKYNKEKVQRWTGLSGEKLTKFVLYCHFDDNYLLRVNEYDLIKTVMIKLEEFKALNDSI